jgi:ferredoxin
MSQDVYHRLAQHLDDLPGGFPATDEGVELRILKRLFTPEQAELALRLTLIPEEARVVARRAGINTPEAARRLEEMARQGLILSMAIPQQPPLYMAAQYVIGIWEFHVNDLDQDLIQDMRQYAPTLFDHEAWKQVPQLRTIPVGQSLTPEHTIMPYEQAEELVRGQKKFLVAPCICRREHQMTGADCEKPLETCLVFGMAADYYLRNGLGRIIDLAETLDILKQADEAGLVLQPNNARKAVNICCCCGCCCGVLQSFKRHPKPGSLALSPFIAQADADLCDGCGTCVERCQMEALELGDETVQLDQDRCIGCGLCVSTCPSGALSLQRKPQEQQRQVPVDIIQTNVSLGKARGKLSNAKLLKMQLKSKVDRLLASR